MKKYILNGDLPDHPAGTPLVKHGHYWGTPNMAEKTYTQFSPEELQRAIANGWVREVEERIELTPAAVKGIDGDAWFVAKKNDSLFTPEEITLMEKALNGELMEKVDLREFIDWYAGCQRIIRTHAELLEAFNAREK